MGEVVYATISSLDGYIADESGDFSWAEPDEQVHQYANDTIADAGLHLYGRRTYELMTVWETDPAFAASSRVYAEFAARWMDADKVVYSTTLAPEAVVTARTRLERGFDPAAVRALAAGVHGSVHVAGPTLAAQVLRAGLVDVVDQVLFPVTIGGGLPVYPPGLRLDLRLEAVRRFDCGAVALRHRVRTS